MTMRISKFPPITGFGRDFHGVMPPSLPPVPPSPVNPVLIPTFLWMAFMINHISAAIFGKFTATIATEGLGDILAGYDWGMGQLHLPQAPVTGTPSIALKTFGAGHKYWMPSYAVQEAVAGGAMAMVGGGAGAVAVSTSVYMISLQDCIDVGGANTGLVAPLGVGFQVPSTRWVGFGAADMFAGLIGMAGDALSAVVGGALGGKLFKGITSQAASAIAGAAFGAANSYIQGTLSRATSGSGAERGAAGIASLSLIILAPAGIGLLSGQAADAVGGGPRPNDSGPREGVSYASDSGSGSGGGSGSGSGAGGGSGGGSGSGAGGGSGSNP